ncbi:hypothetical protein OAK04_03445 [Verrucomicrobia bacterium]|nr:hypothetical protein [Verrucomicrobiota bacterium]
MAICRLSTGILQWLRGKIGFEKRLGSLNYVHEDPVLQKYRGPICPRLLASLRLNIAISDGALSNVQGKFGPVPNMK